jgi:hypothetical protein
MVMMLSSWLYIASASVLMNSVEGGATSQFNPVESLFGAGGQVSTRNQKKMNYSTPLLMDPFAPTQEEREAERETRRQRQRERNGRLQEAMQYIKPDKVEKVSEEELNSNPALRNLGWGNRNGKANAVQYADPGDDYDMWQQAYRMLGVFIDCDHQSDGNDGSQDDGDKNDGDDGDVNGCSRWMMWASVSAEDGVPCS